MNTPGRTIHNCMQRTSQVSYKKKVFQQNGILTRWDVNKIRDGNVGTE